MKVLLITFNRFELTKKQISHLVSLGISEIFLFNDGPRINNENDFSNVKAIRLYASKIKEVRLTYFAETNLGCGLGVSSAIKWFFSKVESGICADYKFGNKNPGEYVKIDFPLIWGWASWSNRLENFTFDHNLLNLDNIKFKIDNSFWSDRLNSLKTNEVDTWDFQFSIMSMKRGYKWLVPTANSVSNYGFGDGATHTKRKFDFSSKKRTYELNFPLSLSLSADYNNFLHDFYFVRRDKIGTLKMLIIIFVKRWIIG